MNKKYSLSVGINDYPGTDADLQGCVNDATGWHTLLGALGYSAQLLTDAAASKAAVVASLKGMVAQARFGDRIVFTYSGHGSWIPDRDGDESDQRDEVLVMHDFRAGGLLSDDELYEIFQQRRFGVRVYVFSDSCFSGTMSRFVMPAGTPRFLRPEQILTPQQMASTRTRAPLSEAPSRPGTALVSGCSDTEYSYDAYIGGRAQGAFSHAALVTYEPGINLRDWYAEIRTVLPSTQYPQTPQLEASAWQKRWTL